MNPAENRILELIQNANLSKLEIYFRSGKICRVHGTEHHPPDLPIKDLSPEFEFQEITLIHEQGKAKTIRRMFKEKF